MQLFRAAGLKAKSQRHIELIESLEERRLLSAGVLDTTFNATGQYISGVINSGAQHIALQSNGNFVVAIADGGIDARQFSPTGERLAAFSTKNNVSALYPRGAALAVQSDDKVLLGGISFYDSFNEGTAVVARFQPTGQLDSNWNGTGLSQITLPGVKLLSITALAVQSDGKVIAAGEADDSMFVARFKTDGTLDTTFDGDGIKTFSFPQGTASSFVGAGMTYWESARGVAVQDDGKIVVDGTLETQPDDAFSVWVGIGIARLNSDGAIDNTFGAGGEVVLGGGVYPITSASVDAGGLKLQPDGRMVMSVVLDNSSSLLRLNTNGSLDTSFDQDGVLTLPESGTDAFDFLSNGQMMVVSASGTSTELRRVNRDGSIDNTFGTSGVVSTEWNTPTSGIAQVNASVLVIQTDGKALVGVQRVASQYAYVGESGMGLARYLMDMPGSISGTVFNDAAGDGMKDSSETGLAGITVYNDANNNNKLDSGEANTITDANGAYQFSGLASGNYKIRQILPFGWSQTTPAKNYGWTITLATNQNVTAKDFGAKQLVALGHCTIAGTIWDDLNGNGTTDANEIVNGRTVYIDVNHNDVLDAGEPTTVTSNGHYEFDNLAPATYYVREVLPAGWRVRFPSVGEWGVSFGADGQLMLSGDFVNERIPAGGSISGTVFNDLDGDRVKDSSEAGVAGVTIYNDANNNSRLDNGELTTTTDGNGDYTLGGLSSGAYKIRQILQTGWSQTTPAKGYGWTISLSTNQQLTGRDFGTKENNIAPPPTTGASIAGVVYNDANANAKQDAGELGVAGAMLYNDANNNVKLDAGELTTVTDANGAYRFTGLSSGNYKIRQILQTGWVQTTPANNYGWTISVSTDQNLSGKNFGTRQTSSSTGGEVTGGSIAGVVWNDVDGDRVKDNNESGVAGITVYNDANNNSKLDSGELTTVTDVNGAYLFTGLSSGNYKIREILQSGWIQTTPSNNYGWTISLSTNQNLTDRNFGTKQNTASTGGQISGMIFNDLDGDGIKDSNETGVGSGWTVYIDLDNDSILDSNEQFTTTDANGDWTLSGLNAGTYKVRQVLQSGWAQTIPTRNYGLNVTLSANQSVSGKLFGSRKIA